MEALKNHLHSRLRNQISHMILFGSIIGLTATGLVSGTTAGVLLIGRTSAHEWLPVFQLLTVIFLTVAGFSSGVFTSLFVSPLLLRHAFFAKSVGEWNGIDVYSVADEDLPGRVPNIFVSGFSFGFGPMKPAIFVGEGAARVLSREAMRAVFAHEVSHLECRHLLKRVGVGISTFIAASVLTSVMLIGLQWSGYAEIGGIFSAFAGIIPAVLTWMTMRKMIWAQEFEADENAMLRHGVSPETLLGALVTLQRAIGGEAHPLVADRMAVCRTKIAARLPIITPVVESEIATAA